MRVLRVGDDIVSFHMDFPNTLSFDNTPPGGCVIPPIPAGLTQPDRGLVSD